MLNRGAFGTARQGQRSFNRLSLGVRGELELTRGTLACIVEDISRSGARISLQPPPPRGAPAVLRVAGNVVFSTVTWTRADRCGLRFDQPVPLDEMQRFLWISQNPEQYERDRMSVAARAWSSGQDAHN
jgi:hypothetical protein